MTSDPLIISFADSGYLPLLQIWLAGLKRLNVERVRIYCLDAQTKDWCDSQGVPATPIPWAGNLHDLWERRIVIFNDLLTAGEAFVQSDIDAIWIKNPFRVGSAVGRSEDLVFSQATIWPPDVQEKWGFTLCCGWFRAKPTDGTRAFFKDLKLDPQPPADDQSCINQALAKLGAKWSHAGKGDYQLTFRDRVIPCWRHPITATFADGPLSVALLPHREFQRMPDGSDHAIVKHYVTPKNCQQKLAALRDYGLI